jgi:hypothetical protein
MPVVDGLTVAELAVMLSLCSVFSGVVLGAVWILVKSAVKSMHDAVEQHAESEAQTLANLNTAVTQLLSRVTSIEQAQRDQPGHEDVYGVKLAVERLIARLDGQDRIIARLDAITQRQDDYLFSRSR